MRAIIAATLFGLMAASGNGQAAERPPALLEPYAGYDVVFGARGQRVLGPSAAPGVQAMLEASKPALPAGCALGDIAIAAEAIAVAITCTSRTFELRLALRASAPINPTAMATSAFAIAPPTTAGAACDPSCQVLRGQVVAAVAERVRAGEGAINWRQVRERRGGGDRWQADMAEAHLALATGNRKPARAALQAALQARPVARLSAAQALDLTLLAGEAKDVAIRRQALARLQTVMKTTEPSTAGGRGLALALTLLQGTDEQALQLAYSCANDQRRCDALPAIRVLAAAGRYRDAAAVLDKGLLDPGAARPAMELLKLRFGLASAAKDANGELAVARRVMTAWPTSPVGQDLLSSALLRSGKYRQAIETLHDLSRRHPERDIVLGRIAGMVAFLRGAAGDDKRYAADLAAIEARMAKAAGEPGDVVARFLDATRKYYSGDLKGARPELEALRRTDNRDPRIPLYLAMAHFWLGHTAIAKTLIDEAVASGPSDPDVFYCRSQIVRNVDLPQAIADLERYVEMTNRPWALNPAKKDQRVKAELDYMRRGLLPPAWDRPGPGRVAFDPANQPGTPASAAARRGTTMAGAATPTAGPDAATQSTPGQDGERTPPAVPSSKLPVAILLALAAAVGARLWSRRRP